MYKQLILMVGVVLLLFPTIYATEYTTLNYTETYNVEEYTMSDDILYINIPQGNYIDFIEYRPKFLPAYHSVKNISTFMYFNDQEYEIRNTIETKTAILNLFSDSIEYKLELYVDGQQNYLKEYENKVFSSCWFTTYQKQNYGNSADVTNEQINIDTHIISNKGKIRYNDVLSVYDSTSFTCPNITVTKDNLDELNMFIGYRQEDTKSKEYYISLLSPTLQVIYTIGFNWLDKENHILNMMLITDYTITTGSFWLTVISQNLAVLTFIVLVFVVPFLAYYNSKTQSGFFNNLVIYYSKVIQIVMSFLRYMVRLMLKCLEIARSLIPFV